MNKEADFKELVGKTIKRLEGLEKGSDAVIFYCTDGSMYSMYHEQNCCESVEIEDVYGDPEDLIGSEIIIAEENSNADGPQLDEYDESYTWTFYKLATKKGYVDIRWYGTSNGYYSEEVSFEKSEGTKMHGTVDLNFDYLGLTWKVEVVPDCEGCVEKVVSVKLWDGNSYFMVKTDKQAFLDDMRDVLQDELDDYYDNLKFVNAEMRMDAAKDEEIL